MDLIDKLCKCSRQLVCAVLCLVCCLTVIYDLALNTFDTVVEYLLCNREDLAYAGEKLTRGNHVEALEFYDERLFSDHCAMAGIFLKLGEAEKVQLLLQKLLKLRCGGSYDLCRSRGERRHLKKFLAEALTMQGYDTEAGSVLSHLTQEEAKDVEKTIWQFLTNADTVGAFDLIIDPAQGDREDEEKWKTEVKISKQFWTKKRKKLTKSLGKATQTADAVFAQLG